jgi:fructokinase
MLPSGKQLGGAPANFAYHAQQLGVESYVISTVGEDEAGKEILDYLEKLKLPAEYVTITPQFATGTVDIEVDEAGIPDYIIHEDVAWDNMPMSGEILKFVQSIDAVCFASLAQRSVTSAQTIKAILGVCSAECLKIYDINIRQSFYSRQLIVENLQLADVFKLNDDEFSLIADMFALRGSEEMVILKLMEKFELEIIALTREDKGSSIYSVNDQSNRNSPKLKIEDTVGAGDAFTAGFAYAYT